METKRVAANVSMMRQICPYAGYLLNTTMKCRVTGRLQVVISAQSLRFNVSLPITLSCMSCATKNSMIISIRINQAEWGFTKTLQRFPPFKPGAVQFHNYVKSCFSLVLNCACKDYLCDKREAYKCEKLILLIKLYEIKQLKGRDVEKAEKKSINQDEDSEERTSCEPSYFFVALMLTIAPQRTPPNSIEGGYFVTLIRCNEFERRFHIDLLIHHR